MQRRHSPSRAERVRKYRSRSQRIESKRARRNARQALITPEDRMKYLLIYGKMIEQGMHNYRELESRAETAGFKYE